MQNIQDKEFDQFIKNQFEDVEMEPSGDLWGAIETKLEGKRKRSIPFYWIAAAIAIIGLSIGLMFMSKDRNHVVTALAVNHRHTRTENKEAGTVLPQTVRVSAVNQITASPVNTAAENFAVIKDHKQSFVADTAADDTKKNLLAMQPLKQIVRPDHQSIAVKQDKMELPPDIVLASADVPEVKDEVINENDQKENKGIRNVGDLVNYVVGKLDKREEKAIKFQTDDDDNSSLVGINIGMLRFGQKKQK
ncbi:hypothetical protein [Pedobacter sp. L105]|uniref:hypothetical protein n=1 Tax=Pedobacter sp. L105 TaxID=1641871 RepID=UPI00131E5C87|nr:hypothetical protein [Pedobacter sp. L105]